MRKIRGFSSGVHALTRAALASSPPPHSHDREALEAGSSPPYKFATLPWHCLRWALFALLAALGLGAGGASAAEVRGALTLLGQVREGDLSRKKETPANVYGELGAGGLHYGASIDTYFRLERDFGRDDSTTQFFVGSARGSFPGGGFSLGRQFIAEAPGMASVADAGRVTVDLGTPVSLTVFGGQPRYFEPTYGSERMSQDEQIFGGSVRAKPWRQGQFGIGFAQLNRDQRVVRQLITANALHSFGRLPGRPDLYGNVAYDVDQQNLDLVRGGFTTFVGQPNLTFNFESAYYKPQDHGQRPAVDLDRREDAIYELFAISHMLQFRGALRYALSKTLSAYGNYSYQRYETVPGIFENGQLASLGLTWLPFEDGLEIVRLEYYLADSRGGQVTGGRASYESRVYDRIVFRTHINLAGYDKVNNQTSMLANGRIGLGYLLLPGLLCELNMEGNRNERFDDDLRFGFLVRYDLGYRSGWTAPAAGLVEQRAGFGRTL